MAGKPVHMAIPSPLFFVSVASKGDRALERLTGSQARRLGKGIPVFLQRVGKRLKIKGMRFALLQGTAKERQVRDGV